MCLDIGIEYSGHLRSVSSSVLTRSKTYHHKDSEQDKNEEDNQVEDGKIKDPRRTKSYGTLSRVHLPMTPKLVRFLQK